MASHNNNRLQNWHESFNLLDEEEEEEEDLDEDGGSSRSNQNLNRSFVDFLFDGGGNSNHNSFSLSDQPFVPVPDVPVVSQEQLSDSFIARSYPT